MTEAARPLIAQGQRLVPAAEAADRLHFPPGDGPDQELAEADVFHRLHCLFASLCPSQVRSLRLVPLYAPPRASAHRLQ